MFNYLVKYITFPFYYKHRGIPLLKALKELEKSQWYTREQLAQLQFEKMKRLVTHAYRSTKYYKELFDARSFVPEQLRSLNDFKNIPVLPKAVAKEHLDALRAHHAKKELYFRSSGSSGLPITVYKDEQALGYQMAAKWRGRRWNGIDIGDRILQLWGTDKNKTKRDVIEDRLIENKSFFNSEDINEPGLKELVKQYHAIKPRLFYGYAHSMYEFGYLIKKHNISLRHYPSLIISACEMLMPYQKKLMEEVFRARVVNEYGSKEFHHIAFECPEGNMHIAEENVIVEFLNNGQPALEGALADIFVTDLTNFEMPLIRYQLGDRGSYRNFDCPCGRKLQVMDIRIGRDKDMVILKNGSKIDSCIFALPQKMLLFDEVRAFKVIQKELTHFEVLMDTTDTAQNQLHSHFESVFKEYIGSDSKVDYKRVSPVPNDQAGKLRYFICEVR